MLNALRRFLAVFVAFAVIGGTMSQLAWSAEYSMVAVGTPCDMMMPAQADDGHSAPMAPCKMIGVNCLKQLGCVADNALPARFASLGAIAHHTSVNYWATWSNLAGVVREPEPLPPRTT